MSSIADKIKQYKEAGANESKSSFAPTVFLTNGDMVKDKKTGKKTWEGVELFLEGTLVGRTLVSVGTGNEASKKPVYTLTLKETNAPVKTKQDVNGKKEYVDVTVKAGDEVAVFAPANLDRGLTDAKVGDTVLIVYRGQETVRTRFGAKDTHQFSVLNMKNGTSAMVTNDRTGEKTEANAAAKPSDTGVKAAADDGNW
jgi:hypothetical protein